MSESEHRVIFDSLGAYALGALPEGELQRVSAHLESCPICAADAAALERAATRLVDVVPAVDPSPQLRDRIMAVVENEAALLRTTASPPEEHRASPARRRGWFDALSLRWAAAAAVLLILGGVAGATLWESGAAGDTQTLAAEVGGNHAWVEIGDGGAQLVVDELAAPPKGKVYELWIQRGDAAPRPAADDPERATFVVQSGRVDIPARLGPGDRVMVTAERHGGSKIPTSPPVVITSRV